MKRGELVRLLEKSGCCLDREGGRHSIYLNPATGKKAPMPRHMEIDNKLAKKIRRQLGLED